MTLYADKSGRLHIEPLSGGYVRDAEVRRQLKEMAKREKRDRITTWLIISGIVIVYGIILFCDCVHTSSL